MAAGALEAASGGVFLALITCAYALAAAWFWSRRDFVPIRPRRPRLTLLLSLFFWLHGVLLSLELAFQHSLPCGFDNLLVVTANVGLCLVFIVRGLDLFHRYERAHAMLEDNSSESELSVSGIDETEARSSAPSFDGALAGAPSLMPPQGLAPPSPSPSPPHSRASSAVELAERPPSPMPSDGPLLGAPEAEARLAADEAPTFAPAVVPLGAGRVARVDRRWYFDSRFLRVYVAVCIVIPSFGVIYTWAATDALDGTADPWCGAEHPVLFWCYQTFAVLVVLVAVPLSWRIREVHDQFFIKREMAALVAICIAVHLVLTAFGAVWSEERELQFPLQHYLAMMQSVAFVVLALALPIRRSYDEEAAGQAAQATLSAAAGAADADDELAGVLATKDEREVLMRFLVESFCPETLVFWEAVADYRRRVRALVAKRRGPARQLRAARAHAQRVYAKFVARNAPVEVNLPSALARPLHEALAEGGGSHLGLEDYAKLFDAAELEIVRLMRNDPFMRFRRSPLYSDVLELRLRRRTVQDALKAVEIV